MYQTWMRRRRPVTMLFKRTKSKNVHLMKDVMAMAIQALFRGRAARRQVDLKYHTTAVIVIQCHYRDGRLDVSWRFIQLREKRRSSGPTLLKGYMRIYWMNLESRSTSPP